MFVRWVAVFGSIKTQVWSLILRRLVRATMLQEEKKKVSKTDDQAVIIAPEVPAMRLISLDGDQTTA